MTKRWRDACAEPNTRVFDITGRPMKGWIVVDAGGLAADDALKRWLDAGADYAATLPSKWSAVGEIRGRR